jgi:hypothetical protein
MIYSFLLNNYEGSMFPFDFSNSMVYDCYGNQIVHDNSNGRVFYLVKPSQGLWLQVEKIRRYKNYARLFGTFWQEGKQWNGYYDFDLKDDYDGLNLKALDHIEHLMQNLAS